MPFSSTTDPALHGAVAGGLFVLCTNNLVVNGVTVAHEAGHAVTGLLFGSSLKSIKIQTNERGATKVAPRPFWPARAIFYMAGYTAPPLVGLAMVWAIIRNHIDVAFLVGLVLLLVSVPFWEGWWTALCGVLHIGVFGAGLVVGPDLARGLAGGVAAVGLVGGLDMASRHVRGNWKRGDGSDVGEVAKALFLPVSAAKFLFMAAVLATEAAALYLVLGDRLTGTGP